MRNARNKSQHHRTMPRDTTLAWPTTDWTEHETRGGVKGANARCLYLQLDAIYTHSQKSRYIPYTVCCDDL